jgi:hypothetical protein
MLFTVPEQLGLLLLGSLLLVVLFVGRVEVQGWLWRYGIAVMTHSVISVDHGCLASNEQTL